MTNEEARAILNDAAKYARQCVDMGDDSAIPNYDALKLAIDALLDAVRWRDPLGTFAPENRTDLREHTAKVIVEEDEDWIYMSCSYCEKILEDGDTDGYEWSGCVGNYCQYCGAKFEDEGDTEC